MSSKKMLIDAAHPEEIRVVTLSGTRLEDFDAEAAARKQLKGNIYLAKVARVEPSLQAAFVEYGGNRHGFLAFNEIHPDYYQIPIADREALLAEEEAEEAAHEDHETADNSGDDTAARAVETIGGYDEEAETRRRRQQISRRYRIQEVIKPRQVILVQVVKEERGNKGAALTTYLSLAGRYCVLMPNTARGGGISRKISSVKDRKRLKSIVSELDIPEGMGVIVRTAGAERTRAEIKRDFDYLLRLWDQVRTATLQSVAPALVYEEADLIKRAIRDGYSRDIEEVIVDGDEAFKAARDFMKLLTPSHAKRVKRAALDGVPLFHHYQIESQLDALHSPQVQLRSGGYIVINTTEALVAIDVNSGRATRERNIEETALRTNLEAADEVARQLRLRDLAGLVVIDFIDMEQNRNQQQVERRLKEAMRSDRARIQIGRISPFGLLELSRQRLRPSVLETSFALCEHCHGTGMRRTVHSAALHLLRMIEQDGIKRKGGAMTVAVQPEVAFYVLNQKRKNLADIEARYDIQVRFRGDESLIPPEYRIERDRSANAQNGAAEGKEVKEARAQTDQGAENRARSAAAPERQAGNDGEQTEGESKRRRRPRRRRKSDDAQPVEAIAADGNGGNDNTAASNEPADAAATTADGSDNATDATTGETHAGGEEESGTTKRRRRGRRGGRRRQRNRPEGTNAEGTGTEGDGNAEGRNTENANAENGENRPQAVVSDQAHQPTSGDPVGTDNGNLFSAGHGNAENGTVSERPDTVNGSAEEDRQAPALFETPAHAEDTVAADNGAAAAPEAAPAPTARRSRGRKRTETAPAADDNAGNNATDTVAPLPVAVAESDEATESPRQTEVVNVDEASSPASKRGGWWKRLTS